MAEPLDVDQQYTLTRINADWRPVHQATLLFVINDGNVLLIRKKRGLGAGKINGPGGKLDDCLLYTSPSPRDGLLSRMPSSA